MGDRGCQDALADRGVDEPEAVPRITGIRQVEEGASGTVGDHGDHAALPRSVPR